MHVSFYRSSSFKSVSQKLDRAWEVCMLLRSELELPILKNLDKDQPPTFSMEVGMYIDSSIVIEYKYIVSILVFQSKRK